MNIRPVTPSELSTYDELARQHGSLFNDSKWLALFGKQAQVLGVFAGDGRMVGGVSFYQERRWGLRILRSAPFTPTCGPFVAVKSQNPVTVLEERRSVLECVAEYLEKQSAAICTLSLERGILDALPFFWHGYKVVPNYTYLLNLAVPLDQIRKNMSPIRRNDISKGTRDGLVVKQTTDLAVVRDLVLATFGRQEKFVDKGYLEAILFHYANPTNSFGFTTYRGENPISTCFIVHDAKTAYYLLGGYRAEDRHHGAGPLAVFAAIQHSQELGLKTFDFEGSMVPAIERYFRGFGGQLTPYLTVNKGWLPVEMALKLIRRQIF